MANEAEKLKILKEIFGDCYSSGHEFLFVCKNPICKSDGKKKLSINLEKNCTKCWRCDESYKHIFGIIKKYGIHKDVESWKEIDSTIDLSKFEETFNFEPKKIELQEKPIELPKEFISLCNKSTETITQQPRNYLLNRGVSEEDIKLWKMGCCFDGPYKNRIIVPSFDKNGELNFFIGRTFVKDRKRYWNPEVNRNDIIFNELNIFWDEPITLVEGVFDAINASNSIPLLGSSLKEDSYLFEQIIKNNADVYIALDPDAEKKAMKLIKNLSKYDINIFKVPIPEDKDVGDMLKTDFIEAKSRSTLFNNDILLRTQIQGI